MLEQSSVPRRAVPTLVELGSTGPDANLGRARFPGRAANLGRARVPRGAVPTLVELWVGTRSRRANLFLSGRNLKHRWRATSPSNGQAKTSVRNLPAPPPSPFRELPVPFFVWGFKELKHPAQLAA